MVVLGIVALGMVVLGLVVLGLVQVPQKCTYDSVRRNLDQLYEGSTVRGKTLQEIHMYLVRLGRKDVRSKTLKERWT